MKNAKDKKVQSSVSRFGSHRSMVVEPLLLVIAYGWHPEMHRAGEVTCRDEKGLYQTTPNQLDSGLADPNRHSWKARGLI